MLVDSTMGLEHAALKTASRTTCDLVVFVVGGLGTGVRDTDYDIPGGVY